ncbi:unnamed protein product [Brassica oleracea]
MFVWLSKKKKKVCLYSSGTHKYCAAFVCGLKATIVGIFVR